MTTHLKKITNALPGLYRIWIFSFSFLSSFFIEACCNNYISRVVHTIGKKLVGLYKIVIHIKGNFFNVSSRT